MARPIVAVASADAHARIGLFDTDPYRRRIALHLPGYEQVFRTFSIALPDVTLVQDAVKDARAVLDAIRRGQVFSAIDALASPIALSYTATSGNARAGMGELLQTSGTVTFTVTSNAPPGSTISIVRSGTVIKSVTAASLAVETTEAGAYRVEIQLAGGPGEPPVPWIVTNPIYVMPLRPVAPTIEPSLSKGTELRYGNGPAAGWRIESSPLAQGAFDVVPALGGTQISLRYALSGSPADSPYVALVMPAGEKLSEYDGLQFTARSSPPTRISVQLRTPDGTQGQRWHRSVFLDENARTVTVLFNDMRPSGTTESQQPRLAAIRDVLFVVDTVNTKPGASGQIWIDEIRVGR
jgi:hypothetical protein